MLTTFYEVVDKDGDPQIVNMEHVLRIAVTTSNMTLFIMRDGDKFVCKHSMDQVRELLFAIRDVGPIPPREPKMRPT